MDIAKIFKSKTRREIFRLYFTNPDNEYYLRELERLLSIPVSMIRKELLRLVADGVFDSRKVGNLTYFYINKEYPLFDELSSIVFKTIGIKGLLQKTLEKLSGIQVAFIYGSFAKNEANASSDVDLFLVGDIEEDELVREINELEKRLKREINYSVYSKRDFTEKKRKRDPFIVDLLENPKIFLIGDKHDI
jgi:predicted nucleotidyltransferase